MINVSSQWGHVGLVWGVALSLSLFVTISMLYKNCFKTPDIKKLYFIFMGSIYSIVSVITYIKLQDIKFLVMFLIYFVVILGAVTLLILMLKVLVFRYLQKKQFMGNINNHKFWVFSRLLSVVITVVVCGIYAINITHYIHFYEIFIVLLVYPFIVLVVSKGYFFYHDFRKIKNKK